VHNFGTALQGYLITAHHSYAEKQNAIARRLLPSAMLERWPHAYSQSHSSTGLDSDFPGRPGPNRRGWSLVRTKV